jgi:hypothetical protein
MASSTQRRELVDVAPGALVATANGLGRRRVLEQAPEEREVVTAAGEVDRPALELGRQQVVHVVGRRGRITTTPDDRSHQTR